MIEVHQFIPSFVARDAQGAHVVQVQRVLRGMGIESDIYSGDVDPATSVEARPYRSFARERHSPQTWILYQLSTGSAMAHWVLQRPEPKIVNYHNITPRHLLSRWSPAVGDEVTHGRDQLARLARVTELAIAVSGFNEKELVDAGYRSTAVVPLFVDLGGPERAAAASGERMPARGRGARWLFVGRLIPNKCQHHLIAALAAYRTLYDPGADLVLVGKSTFDSYTRVLHAYASELGLDGAVHFEGSVSPAALAAHYRAADVVVCLSDHEGFCAPLLEAMIHEVPIVAFAAAAVPETVGEAGLLLEAKSPSTVAAAVHRVLTDAPLRRHLVARGRRRAADFAPERTAERLREVIGALVDAGRP